MSAADLPNGQYYDYTAQSQYVPNSPDTFYGNVIVQPPTRTTSDSTVDSANTPPSHTSRSRRTVARPSHSNPQSQSTQSKIYSNVESLDLNMSQGPSTQVRKDREHHLASTPREALVQLAVRREHEIKKAKQLATTATLQLELARDALTREVEARKLLEDEKYQSSIKTTQAIINAQTESINSQQEIGTYKLQIENLRSELKRAKDVVRAVEEERDKAEQALARSRSNMRQVKEENVLLLAREEGRREGFEEGLRQGRVALASSEPQGDLSKAQRSSHKHRRRSRTPPPSGPSAEERAIYERELMRIKQLLANTESERDTARQNAKNLGRDCQRLQDENGKLLEQRKKLELELEHERSGRLNAERERETMRRVYEANLKHLEDGKRTSLAVKEKELEELRQELKKHEKEHADAQASAQKEIALERERVKKLEEDMVRERERERLRGERDLEREKEKEKETAATIAAAAAAAVTAAVGAAKSSASSHRHGSSVKSSPSPTQSPYQRMPYHPMPAPPMVPAPGMPVGIVMPTVSNGVPRAASSGSQRGHGRDRRMSVGSYSSMMTGLPFDMLQLPSDMLRSDLSAIPEDANSRGPSPAKPQVPVPPIWNANGQPPPNFGAQYGSQAPISMPRAPMDDAAFATPGPGGNIGYQTPSNNYPSTFHLSMPVAPGETPATYQPLVTMPTAPGEAPAGYQPPVTMPTAPGEGAPSYKPPVTMPVTPGEGPPTYKPPIAMPTAPGEGPTTYRPPASIPTAPGDVPGSGAHITMPTAPGEGPSTYQPPVAMPTAPGEAPTSYKPPVSVAAPPGRINNGYAPSVSMPMAPGEGPATYRPPVGSGPSPGGQPGYEPPLSMPKAPGEGPDYHPPPVVPPAPGEAGHQGPIAMPRAPADGIPYTPPVSMPHAPGNVQGYVPPIGMPRAPADGSGYQPPVAMPRAPADGPDYRPPAGGRDAPIAMPRAPADEMGHGYTPRSHTPSISMPRAPADGSGPAYIPGVPSSTISMPWASVDGPGSEYTPRSHTPGISMPRAPSDGSGSVYAPPRSHTPSVSMPRAPSDGANSVHGGARTRTPSITMPRAPSDGAGSLYAPHKSHPSNGVPRAPSDGPGGAYTPRTRSKSISMPRAPADAPGYIPHNDLSQGPGLGPFGMPRAPSDALSYASRSHTPAAGAPRPPSDGYARPSQSHSVGVPRAPSDGYGRPSRTQTPSISIPRAPSDDIGFVPPVIVSRPSSAGRRSYHEYGPDQTLLSPNGVSNRNGPVRRPSIGSTGSYEILIHPPSRPHSVMGDNVQDPHSYLSPNHRPIPLPQPQQVQPVVLPIGLDSQRNINPGGTGTQPNSPVVAPFSLPPNFVPQVLTDRNGISTPISSRPAVLPNVIPPRPPSSQGNGIYGNPLSSRGRDSPPTASRSPFIPPAVLSSSTPNMRSWDLPPGRAGSGGGATPRSVAAALPGQRTPVPIYGPPLSSTGYPSSARNSPMVVPIPMPTIGGGDEDEDGFDQATRENTRLNEMSMPVPILPAATGTKKKKKKRG